jgi:prepilin-type N-terminal cleavage/methylation domain-containing protein
MALTSHAALFGDSRILTRCLLGSRHFSSNRPKSNSAAAGFTLVEILVAAAIIAIAVGGVATTLTVGLNAFRGTRSGSDLETGVNANLAAVKDVAYRLTCCPGSCTATQATVDASASCASKEPGTQNYYFPDPIVGNAAVDAFVDGPCAATALGGSLVESLITAINSDSASSAALPAGVNRSFVTSGAGRNRLVVQYTNGTDVKSYTIIPAVAAWCP